MLVFYGIVRFLLEFLRDDNPFEFDGLTVSQNLSVAAAISGAVLMVVFAIIGPGKSAMTAAAEENNFRKLREQPRAENFTPSQPFFFQPINSF